MLKIGDFAPVFDLPNADMEMISLSAYRNKQCIILYFYPKDDTPGCTLEAIDFSDLEQGFLQENCVVLGVSMDDCLSHASFRDKHGLSLQLLADSEGKVCEKYGVLQEKLLGGRKKICIQRSTFVIDESGRIRHAFYGVSPKGHANEILGLIKGQNHLSKTLYIA